MFYDSGLLQDVSLALYFNPGASGGHAGEISENGQSSNWVPAPSYGEWVHTSGIQPGQTVGSRQW